MDNTSLYGQIVIGSPGAGKTTFTYAFAEYMNAKCANNKQTNKKEKLKKVCIVNLDPANECVPYVPDIDIRLIVQLNEILKDEIIGSNSAIIKCMDLILKNIDWLFEEIEKFIEAPLVTVDYFLFDCPGQIELFTHNNTFAKILSKLSTHSFKNGKYKGLKLITTNFIDSLICLNIDNYLSASLISLITMINLPFPHINVMSKCDLIEKDKNDTRLPFNFQQFLDADLRYMNTAQEENCGKDKYQNLTKSICGLIEDYGLIQYTPCNIQNSESMNNLMKIIHKVLQYTMISKQSNTQLDTKDMDNSPLLYPNIEKLELTDIFQQINFNI